MAFTVQVILGAIALFCVFPLAVLAVEGFCALCARPRSSTNPGTGSPTRVAVLVPAHNEELGLPKTLADIVAGLRPGDRCVVVADNCQDGTAQAARQFPVEVLERSDQVRRGKGYALQHGIAHLKADPPDAVLVIDADCRVDPASLHILAEATAAWGCPVQGGNILYPPADSSFGNRVSAFAFHFKNHVRPLGLAQFGGPCLLFGTGMAFPWSILASTSLGTADSVEDMQLAVQLALAGKAARYLPAPCVSGILPSGASAAKSQRQRWEHGHVRTLLRYAPRLLWEGLRRGKLQLLLLGADLAVPPLSLLALLVVVASAVEMGGGLLTGVWIWFGILAGATGLAALAILMAWSRFGRQFLPFRDLVLIPVYIVRKLPIYLALLWKPQKAWNERPAAAGLIESRDHSP